MAKGLRFYRDDGLPGLKDCESTAVFCEWMNEMFNALNLGSDSEGMKPDCSNFKILQESLKKLDEWEERIEQKEISKNLFLTTQTVDGLRVTLKFSMDLTCELVEKYGFNELYTGKVNQDALEV
ncbi:uncharacterized protein LOC113005759 [Solenopsis invicta]|uniref:uncharacterized protein LOC113005759 n=1 Tax=Solenopsis invicta TaxID=13686 RepID=UPI000E33E98E|nr:uncharacterized protein LOC113005759 [Solenopsis invicta]XP_039304134.1 uncharacterized protein LOC113005759 [Solenopsis invicta]